MSGWGWSFQGFIQSNFPFTSLPTQLHRRDVRLTMGERMIIVKVGGSRGIEFGPLFDEIRHLRATGQQLLLVHGGSSEMNDVATALGTPPRFITSISGFESRFTDDEAMGIFTMIYCGKRNKSIVEALQERGVNSVGLSGADGRTIVARQKEAIRIIENGRKKVLRGDRSGAITEVRRGVLDALLGQKILPVLCPPAIDESTGRLLNVDGDRMAGALAVAYQARALVILSNVPGLLRDVELSHTDPENLIRHIEVGGGSDPYSCARGRMKKKVMGAVEALEGGVERVVISSANTLCPIQSALSGHGTTLQLSPDVATKRVNG